MQNLEKENLNQEFTISKAFVTPLTIELFPPFLGSFH